MRKSFGKFSRRQWISAGAVVVILLIALVITSSRGTASTTGTYQTVRAARGDLTATVGETGTVRALQSATLNWQTGGTVQKVNVKVGDKVSQGEVLAALTNTSLPQNVIMAESDLVAAQKALDDLMHSDTERANAWITVRDAQDAYQTSYDYRVSLNGVTWIANVSYVYRYGHQNAVVRWHRGYVDSDTIAKADADLALKKAQLDDAQRAYDRLKAGPNQDDLAAAQARVNSAQATLNMASILAPFDGTLTEADPFPGDQVSPNQGAFRVDNLSELLVDVQVSEVDINSIAVGQPAALTFDAVSGKEYQGQVLAVSQAGESTSGTVNFTVTVELTDGDSLVKPGMTAAVSIVTDQVKGQILVPDQAVRLVNGKRLVYILAGGKPQPIDLTLGASSDTQSAVLTGNLKVGDLIILNPPTPIQRPGGGGGAPFGGGG